MGEGKGRRAGEEEGDGASGVGCRVGATGRETGSGEGWAGGRPGRTSGSETTGKRCLASPTGILWTRTGVGRVGVRDGTKETFLPVPSGPPFGRDTTLGSLGFFPDVGVFASSVPPLSARTRVDPPVSSPPRDPCGNPSPTPRGSRVRFSLPSADRRTSPSPTESSRTPGPGGLGGRRAGRGFGM